jgi:hypothetical protein
LQGPEFKSHIVTKTKPNKQNTKANQNSTLGVILPYLFILFVCLFCFAVLGLELRVYTLSRSTSLFFL